MNHRFRLRLPVGPHLGGSAHAAVGACLFAGVMLLLLVRSASAGRPSTDTAPITTAAVAAASIEPLEGGGGSIVPPVALSKWGPAPRITSTTPPPEVAALGALLFDEASASVLYAKGEHARLGPASLTKIMTALIALERAARDELVEVTVDSRTMRGSTVMGLVPGERLSLEGLLYGLMLPSGNDAALAIAQHVGGGTARFVELMNQRAAELGLEDTHFANPHGLDAAGHYSSAHDLALLTRAAMQRQDFRELAATRAVTVTGALNTYQLGTLNPLFGRIDGVDGVKTGYTRTAQQTMVGTVTRDGHRVYVVLLRSNDRASDSLTLLRWAFASWAWPLLSEAIAVDGA